MTRSTGSILLFLLFAGAAAAAQSNLVSSHAISDDQRESMVSGSFIPRPYVYFGPSLMGGGYAPVTVRSEAGINLEATHIVFRVLGAYDNGHKVNDNDQPNPNGHDRYLDSAVYYRLASKGWSGNLYFGGGYTWSELSTTNYSKGAGRYQLGGGYDWSRRACELCRRSFSMRLNMDWITAGQDWQNGSHGPSISLTIPSPRENRHWFYRETVSIYRFHESVTEPSNLALTVQQRADKSVDSFADFGIVCRF